MRSGAIQMRTPVRNYGSKMSAKENLRTRLTRHTYNFWPCYRGTGARIVFISSDFRTVRIRLPLSLKTRNYVGTIFGGSMFAATDPLLMIMLMRNLGPGYKVWDKASTIRYLKPGRETLFAEFVITEQELDQIRQELQSQRSLDRIYQVELKTAAGEVCAQVEKTIYIRPDRPSRGT
jgi:acyl-coenzyme A thioesterase PaaI-like protein